MIIKLPDRKDKKRWHAWFAWRPIVTENRELVWCRKVWRKKWSFTGGGTAGTASGYRYTVKDPNHTACPGGYI